MGRTAALTLLLFLLVLAGAVEVYAPSRVRVGEEAEALALVNGVQGAGHIKVVAPSGKEQEYAGGYARFGVGEAGVWKVEYGGVSREMVAETSVSMPAYAEPLAYGLFALALVLIAYSYYRGRRKLFVGKKCEGNTVIIEVRNSGEELLGVRVLDRVPEDARLDLPKGARESASVEGRCVRWSIPVLHAGERVVLKYGIRTSARFLPAAEVRASLAREIRATSDEVRF